MSVKKQGAIQRFSGLSTDTKPTGSTIAIGSTFYEYDSNDTYFTPDNANWYIKDSKSVKVFPVTTTVSAATAYSSGDVIANTQTATSAVAWAFSAVAGYNGGTGEIIQAQLVAQTANPSIEAVAYLFNASPGGALADNAANTSPVWADVSTGIYIGRLDFPKMTTRGDAWLPESASCLPLSFSTSSTADDLFAIIVTATAATINTSSREMTLTLWARRS